MSNIRYPVSKEVIQAVILFIVIVALSYIVFPLLPVAINYVLAAVIVGAFFFSEVIVYTLYALLLLVWLKYTPGITAELIYIAGSAILTFLLVKLVVLKRSFFACLILLAVFHTIFWAIFYSGSFFASVYFYLTFLYTGALVVVLYAIHTWAQRISHWKTR